MDARGVQQLGAPPRYETVSAFVHSILSDIQSIPPSIGGDVFVLVESRVSIERLTGFLTSLKSIQLPPSADTLRTLQNFLEQRWESIRKTDAIYCHQPNSAINRVCLLLAQKLAVYQDKHPYELLMPSAAGFMDYFPHHTSDTIKLTEFIMRDTDKPLLVMDAFTLIDREMAPANHLDLAAQSHVTGKLTLNEDRLLSKHSPAAESYYRLLKSRNSQPQEKEAAKERLSQFMSVIDAQYEPKSTYGLTGKRKLAKLILEYVGDRKKLVALFAHTIPLTGWQEFQAGISDDDYFRYMGMGGIEIQRASAIETDAEYQARRFKHIEQTLKTLLTPPTSRALHELNDILLVVEDIEHKKAALRAYTYCLLQLYRRVRDAQPETTSVMGRYTSGFFQLSSYGCSKDEKLKACAAIEKVLVESHSLVELSRALEGDEMRKHQKAIQEGQLGYYLGIIKNAIDRACSLEDPTRRRDWVRTVA